MMAPLPGEEVSEFPYLFVAKTLANMLDPHGQLNGSDVRTLVGT